MRMRVEQKARIIALAVFVPAIGVHSAAATANPRDGAPKRQAPNEPKPERLPPTTAPLRASVPSPRRCVAAGRLITSALAPLAFFGLLGCCRMSRKEKWYVAGLAFECTQCGNCCSGAPGYVWVTREEIRRISLRLGRTDGTLSKEHLRRVGLNKYSLTERPGGDCIFLTRADGKSGCSIYDVRPLQCRTWPFWSGNVKSPDSWNSVAGGCPGANRGKHHDFVAIEDLRLKKSW